jgi:hypothetical protein
MTHIPDDRFFGTVHFAVERDCHLHSPQTCSEVPAILETNSNDALSQIFCKLPKLVNIKRPELVWR